jgi:hypothetical protein
VRQFTSTTPIRKEWKEGRASETTRRTRERRMTGDQVDSKTGKLERTNTEGLKLERRTCEYENIHDVRKHEARENERWARN